MKDLIKKVYEEKMQNGDVEKIISENIDSYIKQVIGELFGRFGPAHEALKAKISPIMTEAIERSDFTAYVEKIKFLLNESAKKSQLSDLSGTLEAINDVLKTTNPMLESINDKKSVRLSEIFNKYCEFVENQYEEDDFCEADIEENYDEKFANVSCKMLIEKESNNDWFYGHERYRIILTNDNAEYAQEYCHRNTNVSFHLCWNYNKTELHIESDFHKITIFDIRFAPSFIVYLWAIQNRYIKVELDEEESIEKEIKIEF